MTETIEMNHLGQILEELGIKWCNINIYPYEQFFLKEKQLEKVR